jgi:hypothetical protein
MRAKELRFLQKSWRFDADKPQHMRAMNGPQHSMRETLPAQVG